MGATASGSGGVHCIVLDVTVATHRTYTSARLDVPCTFYDTYSIIAIYTKNF
jgi:hypothetical protein